MANAKNVTTAKPKINGAIYSAPLATSLPKDATTSLDPAFKELGYCSEDGLTNSTTREFEDTKAWGGNIVHTAQTEFKDEFKFKLIEALNIEVLKEIFGDENVTGDLSAGVAIKVNSSDRDYRSWVLEIVFKKGILKRIVIPNAKITNISEIIYNTKEPVGYEITLSATADEQGQTHYEYIKQG